MLTAMIESAKRRWFAKPEIIDALKKRNRADLVQALAAPDHEREFGPIADELLAADAQRDQHRALARELPAAQQRHKELTAFIDAERAKEQERHQAYRLMIAPHIAERTTLETKLVQLEMSPRWLLQHIPADAQARLDTLAGERAALLPTIAQHAEAQASHRRTIERSEQRIERLRNGINKNSEHTRNEIAQEQTIVANATRKADEHAAAAAEGNAAVGEITSEFDGILARIKRGE